MKSIILFLITPACLQGNKNYLGSFNRTFLFNYLLVRNILFLGLLYSCLIKTNHLEFITSFIIHLLLLKRIVVYRIQFARSIFKSLPYPQWPQWQICIYSLLKTTFRNITTKLKMRWWRTTNACIPAKKKT